MVVVRHVLIAVLCLVLLSGCAAPEDTALATAQARLFSAMHGGDVAVSATQYDAASAAPLRDLLAQECPSGLPDAFTRAVLTAGADTLTLYVDAQGAVACGLYKPASPREPLVRAKADAPSPEVALTVNGEPLTYAQIQGEADRAGVTSNDDLVGVINALINAELLRQEALAIAPDEEDLVEARAQSLVQLGASEETLDDVLAGAGVDRVWFDEQVFASARMSALLRERLLLDEVSVSEDDAKNTYLANPNRFVQSETAVARFLYVAGDGRSREGLETRVNEVAARVPQEEFCALVRVYTDDVPSRETCGSYRIPRGGLDARVEAAAFGTPVNQTAVVVTESGVYFVQTVEVLPQSVVPYPQIAENLRTSLRDQLLQERLHLYLGVLRSQADVVSYLE